MKTINIITGPELDDFQFRDLIGDIHPRHLLKFPEAKHGARKTREMIARMLYAYDEIWIVSRYSIAMEAAVELIETASKTGLELDHTSLNVILYRNEHSMAPTHHGLDEELMLTNNWPTGILW